MKKINAKFTSKCFETGKILNKGDLIFYDVYTKKVYHTSAKKVIEYIETENIKKYINDHENAIFEKYENNYYNF